MGGDWGFGTMSFTLQGQDEEDILVYNSLIVVQLVCRNKRF